MQVGRLDILLREAEPGEEIEPRIGEFRLADAEPLFQEFLAERPLVEGELDVEGGGERHLELAEHLLGEALAR